MPNIVFIENNGLKRKELTKVLTIAGFGVTEASCVISGLELALAHAVELILVNEYLPGLHALDLLELKNLEPLLANLPVVIIASSPKRKEELFLAGCDDLLISPLDHSELVFRLRAILRRGSRKGINGDFSHLNILDFIQMLVAAGRDGVLEVDCSRILGTLCFQEGQVVYARCQDKVGEKAFFTLLREAQKGGKFSFQSGRLHAQEININKRTDHLLLGLANVLDEEGREV